MAAFSQTSSVWVRACTLPSGSLKDISKRLLAFNESRVSVGWRVSRAQAVRALSPGCLPWMRPNKETLAFSAQVDRSDERRSSGTVTTTLRSCVSCAGWGVVCCSIVVSEGCLVSFRGCEWIDRAAGLGGDAAPTCASDLYFEVVEGLTS